MTMAKKLEKSMSVFNKKVSKTSFGKIPVAIKQLTNGTYFMSLRPPRRHYQNLPLLPKVGQTQSTLRQQAGVHLLSFRATAT
jgi:hypothetical protein